MLIPQLLTQPPHFEPCLVDPELRVLLFGDVDAAAYVAGEPAVAGKAGRRCAGDPSPFAIVAAQPELQRERTARVEGRTVDIQTGLHVLGMDRPLPATSARLIHRASGGPEPAAIEPRALLVCTAHPDHHRRAVGNRREAFLAGPQNSVRLFPRDRGAEHLGDELQAFERLGRPVTRFLLRTKADRAGRLSIDRKRHDYTGPRSVLGECVALGRVGDVVERREAATGAAARMCVRPRIPLTSRTDRGERIGTTAGG